MATDINLISVQVLWIVRNEIVWLYNYVRYIPLLLLLLYVRYWLFYLFWLQEADSCLLPPGGDMINVHACRSKMLIHAVKPISNTSREILYFWCYAIPQGFPEVVVKFIHTIALQTSWIHNMNVSGRVHVSTFSSTHCSSKRKWCKCYTHDYRNYNTPIVKLYQVYIKYTYISIIVHTVYQTIVLTAPYPACYLHVTYSIVPSIFPSILQIYSVFSIGL